MGGGKIRYKKEDTVYVEKGMGSSLVGRKEERWIGLLNDCLKNVDIWMLGNQ